MRIPLPLIKHIGTIKLRLSQPLIHTIMQLAYPDGEIMTGFDTGWQGFKFSGEMLRAELARVELTEEVEELDDVSLVFGRWVVGVVDGKGVEKSPGGAAEDGGVFLALAAPVLLASGHHLTIHDRPGLCSDRAYYSRKYGYDGEQMHD